MFTQRSCLYLIHSHFDLRVSDFVLDSNDLPECKLRAVLSGSAKGVNAAGFADRRKGVAYLANCKKCLASPFEFFLLTPSPIRYF